MPEFSNVALPLLRSCILPPGFAFESVNNEEIYASIWQTMAYRQLKVPHSLLEWLYGSVVTKRKVERKLTSPFIFKWPKNLQQLEVGWT